MLRASTVPLTAKDIAQTLSVKAIEQEGFLKRLNAMERDEQIQSSQEGYLQLASSSHFVAGRIQGHRDGYGFLIRDDAQADLFLSNAEMQRVMHNDRVLARIMGYDRRGRPEGHIVEITKRANTHVIGRLLNENGVLILAPEDKRIGHDIIIAPRAQGQAKAGQVVSVELIDFPSRHTAPLGKVVEILGEIDDPGMEIEIAVRKHGVPHQFSAAALAQANKLPDKVRPADLHQRVDLRDLPLVTIDGEDARDFDDAVYCEPVKVGRGDGFRLIVAIADVSHYVKPNDALDVDALERSTSVYFPRRVIPMLPEKLSNGLCSLNPGVDRCALVCDLVIDAQGKLHAYQFYPAVMHSAARLTYTEVATLLANTKSLEAKNHAPLLPHLQHLYGAYQLLVNARQKRGAIDFDTVETYIVCNALGKIEQIVPRTRNEAHKLIEECMLAANVCAADFLKRHKHAGLYRVHEGPTEEKLANLRSFLRGVGLSLEGRAKPQASDYSALMAQIRQRPDAQMLQTMLLRSMQQAVYSPDNLGHFGLAYEAYAHFTSPIRRYPDLLTHRAIRALLSGNRYEPALLPNTQLNTALSGHAQTLQNKANTSQKRSRQSSSAIWNEFGLHCSANERRADEASRDVEAWLKCYFMRDKLGAEYGGLVSAVTSFGIFVQLDTLFVEGLVHVTELGPEYFQYDEIKNELRGEHTGTRYRLADRVRVQVSRVDLDTRKIDFVLVQDPPVKASHKNPAHPTAKTGAAKAKKTPKAKTPLANQEPAETARHLSRESAKASSKRTRKNT
ncbi:ribonuclease R [Mycoavidus sp. B2-EB]|nr:ribonuclease R [Mycoavidus sp. B2-EB]